MKHYLSFFAVLSALSFSACSSYVNSPAARDYAAKRTEAFSHPLIARAYHAKPAIRFPATIGLASQDKETQQAIRDLDAANKLDELKRLPKVAGIVKVNSLLYADGPGEYEEGGKKKAIWNESDVVIREAAAKLHTDAVFITKIETHTSDGRVLGPLSTLSLGLFPSNHRHVVATALAALLDTRTGYVYGVLERSAGKSSLTNGWDDLTKERTVRRAQYEAMAKMFGEIPDFWRAVVAKHDR